MTQCNKISFIYMYMTKDTFKTCISSYRHGGQYCGHESGQLGYTIFLECSKYILLMQWRIMQNHHLSFLCHFYDAADSVGQPAAGHKASTWVVGHAIAGFVVVDCCSQFLSQTKTFGRWLVLVVSFKTQTCAKFGGHRDSPSKINQRNKNLQRLLLPMT